MRNIETQLAQWLSGQPELNGIPVSLDVPMQRPERFVTIERVAAAKLADLTKTMLERAWRIPNISSIDMQSTINFPLDESTPRYQITVELTVHKYDVAR